MERTQMYDQVRQLLEEVIQKYENAQLLLIESLGSETATWRERQSLAADLNHIRARYERLVIEDRDEREAA